MKKIVILSTLLSLISFSSKIKLSLNENYTATMENDKALIPVIFKDKLDAVSYTHLTLPTTERV